LPLGSLGLATACEAEGGDGTRLDGCMKLYIPACPNGGAVSLADVDDVKPALVLGSVRGDPACTKSRIAGFSVRQLRFDRHVVGPGWSCLDTLNAPTE
jgi:hypothetical protein